MSKKAILLICIPVLVIAAAVIFMIFTFNSGNGYSGIVTADGVPLANVSVSDGRNVVKTDENGKYYLKGTEKHASLQ